MKILVLGSNSTSAAAFIKYASQLKSVEIIGASRSEHTLNFGVKNFKIAFETSDLESLLKQTLPNCIVNFVGTYSNNFAVDLFANLEIPQRLFDAIVRVDKGIQVLSIGSAAEYGHVQSEDNPIAEDHILNPVSIYGLSKVMQTNLSQFYFKNHGLNVKIARTFNLLDENLTDKLFIGNLHKQIRALKLNALQKIKLGSLDDFRDYISMEDAVQDYMNIILYGEPGHIYNVCSGQKIRMRELVEQVLASRNINMDMVEENKMAYKSRVPIIFGSRKKVDLLNKNRQ